MNYKLKEICEQCQKPLSAEKRGDGAFDVLCFDCQNMVAPGFSEDGLKEQFTIITADQVK